MCTIVALEGGFSKLVVLGYGLGPQFADSFMEELVPYDVDALVNIGLAQKAMDRDKGA